MNSEEGVNGNREVRNIGLDKEIKEINKIKKN